jgi:hypothetical protein
MRNLRFFGSKTALGIAALAVFALVSAGAGAADKVAATVDGKVISLADVDNEGMAANLKAYQGLFDVRKQALDTIIGDMLMEKEAKARGISKDRLVKAEITDKIQPVTDADIEAWYKQNQGRLRGQPLEQLKPRIRSFLAQERDKQARDSFVDTLKQKAKVKISLEPPRVPVKVSAKDPSKGPAEAPVQIVEFSDFQ